MSYRPTLILAAALVLLTFQPIAVAEGEPDGTALSCGFILVNCASETFDVTLEGCSLSNEVYRCTARAKATVTTTAWINPGQYSAAITGVCNRSDAASWALVGVTRIVECTTIVYIGSLGCASFSATLSVSYTGTLAPPPDSATDTTAYTCNPISVILYEHADWAGGFRSFTADDSDFYGETFSNGAPLNDGASSIGVRVGCTAYLYEHANYNGFWWPYSTANYLGSHMNDKASSIEIDC